MSVAATTGKSPDTKSADRLMKARCRLMTRQPFYGTFAVLMQWTPSDMPWLPEPARTMGVRIMSNRVIQCLYYPPFVNNLSIKELYAVVQHEIEHIVRCHCLRVGGRNPHAWNIATDMTINGTKKSPRIGYQESSNNQVIIPMKDSIVWIPEYWATDETAEFYYDKLMENQKRISSKSCPACGRGNAEGGQEKGKGKGKGNKEKGKGSEGDDNCCPACGQANNEYEFGGVRGKAIDNHDIWNQTEVSADEARQIVKSAADQVVEKCQGNVPGHLMEAIEALSKPVVRWREILRHYLGRHVGNRRNTFSRRNRRHNRFGVPGVSRHAAAHVNVIVDTSGSIGKQELEQFFTEIDTISSRAKVNVLQWDHAFQGYDTYRRGDWKKFNVRGRGGTCMEEPVKWLINNGAIADCQIMLTDGYCSWIDPQYINFPFITVITTKEGTTSGPDYGHVVRMDAGE